LNERYNVQFDIYTVPFNKGEGGKALPLEGASNNGYSNYFPRYSPDGRWIVFTQSPTGLVLQPESRLCIIPAEGGALRYLKCNMPTMNSWHSWSPNSKWIVFTCKATSPYTELYITHIDSNGESNPAVRLFRFSNKELAAMVPEFIPFSAKIPRLVSLETDKVPIKNMAIDGR
jgi:Tol biopolymer transport system component